MPSTSSLPGFRDFYPAELSVRTHITNAWREAARRYGFEEYDGPPLESLDLYVEKSGAEIVGQLYNFVDKGGRAVALRWPRRHDDERGRHVLHDVVRLLGGRER